jgi:hypothetical protein
MEEVYDLMEGLLASKADEQMMGFAGFSRGAHHLAAGPSKVCSRCRPFIVRTVVVT